MIRKNGTIFFVTEKDKETILSFSQNFVDVSHN